ncbi:serine protease [Actinoallomurus sp. NPDC050550]|uniref:trypsin-like serine peptidase n=1 Tax=Actinoallomurus sp. NPDC050550 TaxID=3154937 RepID=UPI0033C9D1EA
MSAIVLLAGCGAAHGTTPKVPADRPAAHPYHPTTSAAPTPSPAAGAPTPPPNGTPTAQAAVYGRRVGALFSHDTSGTHFCTASTVDSPNRNLIITAAHCLHGGKDSDYTSDLVFVPGYRDGKAPYGIWKVRTQLVDTRWANSSDEDLDVGFAVLEPLNGKNIADVVGANTLAIDAGFSNVVRVTGYPMQSDRPITCVNSTSKEDTYQLRFDCNGYFPGTSGSPWLTGYDPNTRVGKVVGVIGGRDEGGEEDDVSYSSYFDEDVKHLYDEAVRESVPK